MVKVAEEAIFGPEPVWSDKELTDADLGKAYNWYNYFEDHKTSKKYTLDYLKACKASKDVIASVSANPDWKFTTVGWACRISLRKGKLPERTKSWLNNTLQELAKATPIVEVEETKAPVISIQERMNIQVGNHIAEFEEQLDSFVTNGFQSDFNPYNWLRIKEVKGPLAARIGEYYMPVLKEVSQAMNKDADPQIKEAYAFMSKSDVKKYVEFLTKIVNDTKHTMIRSR